MCQRGFHKYIRAIIDDDLTNYRTMFYPVVRVDKLIMTSIYFHAYKCMNYIMNFHELGNRVYDYLLVATYSDNDVFMKHILDKSDIPINFYQKLYACAVKKGSLKVATLLAEHLGHRIVDNVVPLKECHVELFNIFNKIRKFRYLQELWNIESYVQWLPRGVLEDQIDTLLYDSIEMLYEC